MTYLRVIARRIDIDIPKVYILRPNSNLRPKSRLLHRPILNYHVLRVTYRKRHWTSKLVSLIFGPIVPFLSVSVDSTSVVSVEGVVVSFHDEGQGLVLEGKVDPVCDPVFDVVCELKESVEVYSRVFQLNFEWSGDDTRQSQMGDSEGYKVGRTRLDRGG